MMDDFIKIKVIGEGTYGVVYKGRNKITNNYVAMKKIEVDGDEGVPATAVREMSLLKELEHPNIVRLEDVFLESCGLYLIFECLAMDLKNYMDSFGPGKYIEPGTVKSYLYQINSAILYCHERRVMHRDLKPQNLLIDRNGIIKVGDFGLGRVFSVPIKAYTDEVVTLWYRAPEVLLGAKRYYCPVDIWAMGCIFAEMASNKPLFRGNSEIDQLLRIFRVLGIPTEAHWPKVSTLPHYNPVYNTSQHRALFPKWYCPTLNDHVVNIDEDGIDLLKKMLIHNPMKRITSKAIQEHPFFRNVQLPQRIASIIL